MVEESKEVLSGGLLLESITGGTVRDVCVVDVDDDVGSGTNDVEI